MAHNEDTKRNSSAPVKGAGFANYPDNNLGPQVRQFDDVPSLHEVVLHHFSVKAE